MVVAISGGTGTVSGSIMPGGRPSAEGAAAAASGAGAEAAGGGGGSCGADALLSRAEADCDDERDLLCEDERDLSLCEAERDLPSLCEDARDFSWGAGAGAASTAAAADGECSRLLTGLPARVIDGAEADGADFDADADADADTDFDADVELDGARRFSSDLPGEITLGSGYTDGGATSWTIGFELDAWDLPAFSDLSDLPGEITFGVG